MTEAKLTGLFEKSSACFTSKRGEYITPRRFFKELDDEFHFVLDPCTTVDNPLGLRYIYTEKDDGLSKSWNYDGGSVYINPPYHSRNIVKWVEKAISENKKYGMTIVMLLPARTDVRWFHDYLYNNPKVEVRFIKGLLSFGLPDNSSIAPAPFPSMIVIIRRWDDHDVHLL